MSRNKKVIGTKVTNTRIRILFLCFIMVYAFLSYRTYHIQIVKGEEYSKRVDRQSEDKIDLSTGRGTIYDRNNIALTDIDKKDVIIVSKYDLIKENELKEFILDITEIDEKELYKAIEDSSTSSLVEIEVPDITNDKEKKLNEKGIIVDEKVTRYSKDQTLSHTIGYVWGEENTPISGIEKSMNHILESSNEEYISVFKAGDVGNDGSIDVLDGSINKIDNSGEDRHLKLTIDSKIQKNIEKIMSKIENSMSIIVSDIETGDIISLASSPGFTYDDIARLTTEGENGELINKAISSTYCPASVFKIVILYAALDNHVVDEDSMYNCNGSIKISGETKYCSNKDGHGRQTIEEAFANSCNPAFIDIALDLGQEKIIDAADTLKLTQKVDIGLDEEKEGYIDENIDILNLALGHSTIEFTPLQINQMTQIISNNGAYKPLKIYDSVIDNNFNMIKPIEVIKEEELISPYITNQIKTMMKLVSKEGTGKDLKDLEGGCGVKTGTVQAKDGKHDVEHSWTTGFYPEENSKYAITVFVEGEDINNRLSIPIFEEVCYLLK